MTTADAFSNQPVETMALDGLTRHIVDVHHRYVHETAPQIRRWLARLVERHGNRHPELAQVKSTFDALAYEVETHLAKEEALLFPAIEHLARADRVGGTPDMGLFATILHPMRVMEDDHARAGELLRKLRGLTNGFTAPEDACGTFKACYAEMARFEDGFHQHVRLENNVLFPRALAIEQRLA